MLKYIPDYHIVRGDRDREFNLEDDDQLLSHGGAMILTSPEIITDNKLEYSNGNCEIAIAELPEFKLSTIALYRPPIPNFSLNKFKDILVKVKSYIAEVREKKPGFRIILGGDFNFPERVLEWVQGEHGVYPDPKSGDTDEKVAFRLLTDLVDEFNLEQLVDKPTRNGAILDLLYTNAPELFSDCTVERLKPLSDHDLVTFPLRVSDCSAETVEETPPDIPEILKYNFKQADHERMAQELSTVNWTEKLGQIDGIEDANQVLVSEIESAAERAQVPKYKVKCKTDDRKLKKLLDERKQLHKKLNNIERKPNLRQVHLDTLKKNIEAKNLQIREFIDTRRSKEEEKILGEIKANPAAFYKYANSTRETKVKVGPLKEGVNYESGPKKMADILSRQFKSVFSVPQLNPLGLSGDFNINDEMSDIVLEEKDFRQAIKDMSASSAPGPDGLKASIFKDYVDQLIEPIMLIWRLSLDSGKLPEGTALAVITPIYKGGGACRSLAASYRPVALTNHLTKIFERVLRKQMVTYLEKHNLMNNTQHGFRSGRSTVIL